MSIRYQVTSYNYDPPEWRDRKVATLMAEDMLAGITRPDDEYERIRIITFSKRSLENSRKLAKEAIEKRLPEQSIAQAVNSIKLVKELEEMIIAEGGVGVEASKYLEKYKAEEKLKELEKHDETKTHIKILNKSFGVVYFVTAFVFPALAIVLFLIFKSEVVLVVFGVLLLTTFILGLLTM